MNFLTILMINKAHKEKVQIVQTLEKKCIQLKHTYKQGRLFISTCFQTYK